MRVFFDTNVLVSAYATRGLCSDVLRVVLAEHEVVTSDLVLEELARALLGKIRLPPDTVRDVVAALREHTVQPRPDAPASLPTSDPDDAWVLAAALASGADVLVTGDPDLLDVADSVAGIRIVSPRGFWTQLRGA